MSIFILFTLACGSEPSSDGQAAATTAGQAPYAMAQAQQVTVRVLIEQSWNDHADCGDPLSFADLYWNVFIDGAEHSSGDNPLDDDFNIGGPRDVSKEFAQDVDVSRRYIPIVIQEMDSDGFLGGDDDKCDIDPGSGRDLDLNLDLATCQVSGDASGACSTSIEVGGGIYFLFRITVEEPPHAPGLAVRCLHDPIWPQPGDQLTFVAEALDGDANAMPGVVDDVQIWVDDTTTAGASTAAGAGTFGANQLTHSYTPPASATQILYRCRIQKSGTWVSTGWRIVQIGLPAAGRAVPVLYTGVSDSRVDLLFIADSASYSGPSDAQFLAAVRSAVRDAYYAGRSSIQAGGKTFLAHQDGVNFWVALDTGTAVDANTCGDHCEHDLPPHWDTTYGFVDSGALIHTTPGRDFALRGDRVFSARITSLDNFLHEAGHSPIGLSDEYCCDSYYFESDPYPNLYADIGACVDDPVTIGVTDACQKFGSLDWYRVESAANRGNDLMDDSGDHTANPADLRQIEWYFGLCRDGNC